MEMDRAGGGCPGATPYRRLAPTLEQGHGSVRSDPRLEAGASHVRLRCGPPRRCVWSARGEAGRRRVGPAPRLRRWPEEPCERAFGGGGAQRCWPATMYAGFTEGVSAATDLGIGSGQHVPSGGRARSYVAVRLGEEGPRRSGAAGRCWPRDHVTAVGRRGACGPPIRSDVQIAQRSRCRRGQRPAWGQHQGISGKRGQHRRGQG